MKANITYFKKDYRNVVLNITIALGTVLLANTILLVLSAATIKKLNFNAIPLAFL